LLAEAVNVVEVAVELTEEAELIEEVKVVVTDDHNHILVHFQSAEENAKILVHGLQIVIG